MRTRIWTLVIAGVALAALAASSTAHAAGPLKLKRTAVESGKGSDTKNGILLPFDLTTDRGTVGTAKLILRTQTSNPSASFRSKFSEGKIIARTDVEDRIKKLPIISGSGLFEDAEGVVIFRNGPEEGTLDVTYRIKSY